MHTLPRYLRRTVVAVATLLTASQAHAQGPNGKSPVAAAQFARDSAEIMATIVGETAAFYNKDFNAWASHWVHAPYVRVVGWWPKGGVTVREGWDAVSGEVRQLMKESPNPNPTANQVRRENINMQIRNNVAWLTYDEYGLSTGDTNMDMPGLTRSTRVLEKLDGRWRIAYVGWLLQGATRN